MKVSTEPAELNDKKYKRFVARWTDGHMQFEIASSIFSDDQSPMARAYILEQLARNVVQIAERAPHPG